MRECIGLDFDRVFESLKEFQYKAVCKRGRFPEERNIEIWIGLENSYRRLLVSKVFLGRPPFLRRWAEIFSINSVVHLNGKAFVFVDSGFEDRLLKLYSDFLAPGESLFIEYLYDRETMKLLELGIPPHLTRLGFKLFELGFTWFKDWYFPEGFMEGGPKIQAEKPTNENARDRHVKYLCREVYENITKIRNLAGNAADGEMLFRAFRRAIEFNQRYCSEA
ncbi:MAG: DUF1122 family protein [Thermoproteota archaeon]